MLEDYPRVLDDNTLRVKFTDFEEDSILLKVQCYLDAESLAEYFEIAQELNLKIMDVVEGQSVHFALPGRMIYGSPQAQT